MKKRGARHSNKDNREVCGVKDSVCYGCQHLKFGEIQALLPSGHFSSWKCIKKRILFGGNKEGGQNHFPKSCKERVVIQ